MTTQYNTQATVEFIFDYQSWSILGEKYYVVFVIFSLIVITEPIQTLSYTD